MTVFFALKCDFLAVIARLRLASFETILFRLQAEIRQDLFLFQLRATVTHYKECGPLANLWVKYFETDFKAKYSCVDGRSTHYSFVRDKSFSSKARSKLQSTKVFLVEALCSPRSFACYEAFFP